MIRLVLSMRELKELLRKIDGKPYSRYKSLRGKIILYDNAKAILTKVQSDPHATPSVIEVVIPKEIHKLPKEILINEPKTPIEDFICRRLYEITKKLRRKCGDGYSCYLGIPRPGPWILKRSSVEIKGLELILRFYIGLPAKKRRILGNEATKLLLKDIPKVIDYIVKVNNDVEKLKRHIELFKDQEYLREWLYSHGYTVFIPNNSILPRESSISQKPLTNAIPFISPKELEVCIDLPSGKHVCGMALPEGIIVITGGGYQGKTTLLESIQDGIYNHVLGDGREYVVSRRYTVVVRAEDGRIVNNVDISNFIKELPSSDPSNFRSLKASGSTSMAASISEYLELGVELLLIDEDTSATNLLFKDEIMDKVITNEPIRPLSLLAKELVLKSNTSLIIVTGASSSFLPKANRVILMDRYIPKDITINIKKFGITAQKLPKCTFKLPKTRFFKGIRDVKKVRSKGFRLVITYSDGSKYELNMGFNPRIVEEGQVKFIASIIAWLCKKNIKGYVRDIVGLINDLMRSRGFSAFVSPVPPDLTIVDGFDVMSTINRLYRSMFDIKSSEIYS